MSTTKRTKRIAPAARLKRKTRTNSVQFSPDGESVAIASYDAVSVWVPATGKLVWNTAFDAVGDAFRARFRPDGARVLVGGVAGPLVSVAARSGKVMASYTREGSVMALSYAPGGDRFWIGTGGTAELWTEGGKSPKATVTGKLKRYSDSLEDVAFLPGEASVMFTQNKTLSLWNLGKTPHERYKVTAESAFTTAFPRADGTVISVHLDGGIRFWDASHKPKQPVRKIDTAFDNSKMAVSPDGARALVSDGRGVMALWDLASASVVAELHGHKDHVDSIDISADGTRAVSSGLDFAVLVWDLPPKTAA